jgi:hypothetical protein
VAGLARPSRILRQKLTLEALPVPVAALIEPRLVIVPARKKREYRARTRPAAKTPGALASAPSARPVFVPRAVAAPPASAPKPATLTAEQMEAAVRHKLLGGVA